MRTDAPLPATVPRPGPSPGRIRAARIIAVVADAIQLGFFPAFAPGVMSLVNNALDVGVAAAMVTLVGWHFAFLPSFVAELVPGLDLVPTWTLAVWIATRSRKPDPGAPGAPPG